MDEKNRRPSEEVQLEMPGVVPADTVISAWMEAVRGSEDYPNLKGQYAIFDARTGEYLGVRKLQHRDIGDDRFSENDSTEDDFSPTVPIRIEQIK